MPADRALVLITGGGSGIGRGLVHHFAAAGHPVVACGRRADAIEETRRTAAGSVTAVACDIGTQEGRDALLAAVPPGAPVRLLVHNAAIGDPAPLGAIDVAHFEQSLRVNVVAPLALTQALLPALRRGEGRVLHLGTSVAHSPQRATATYGVTKAAFHRLYQQVNADALGVPCGSLSPGLVDTEGVRDHLAKASALELPHVAFFDRAFAENLTTPMDELMRFVEHLLALDAEIFASKEWRFSEWRQQVAGEPPASKTLAEASAVSLAAPLATAAMAAVAAAVALRWARRGRL